jgi:hypothetical protein
VLVVDECADTSNIDLLESVEARLKRNPQYAYARNIEQLRRLTVLSSSDPLGDYIEYKVSQGVRLGDVKIPALQPETELLSIFKGRKT